jgi:hypothetical protein
MNATLSDIGHAAGKGNDADCHMTERCNRLFKLARRDLRYQRVRSTRAVARFAD